VAKGKIQKGLRTIMVIRMGLRNGISEACVHFKVKGGD
jgi:hypothetical protein